MTSIMTNAAAMAEKTAGMVTDRLFGAMAVCGRNGFARLANLAAQARLVSGSRGCHGRKGESPARVDRAEFACTLFPGGVAGQ